MAKIKVACFFLGHGVYIFNFHAMLTTKISLRRHKRWHMLF